MTFIQAGPLPPTGSVIYAGAIFAKLISAEIGIAMKNRLALAMMLLVLSGCGKSSTPIAHAFAAFRSADHEELLAAKAEAQEALKGAIHPDDDLCFSTALDFERYGAVAIIEKLDQPNLFKATEEARLAYALKLAGEGVQIDPGSFLAHAPLYTNSFAEQCGGRADKIHRVLEDAGPEAGVQDEGRAHYLRDWIRDMKSKHGGAYEEDMRSAALRLQNIGYSAPWPPRTDLVE